MVESVSPRPGPPAGGPAVEVRRSTRRRRTVQAYRDGDRVVVMIPARFSRAQEREWVVKMLARLDGPPRRAAPVSDRALLKRAGQLSDRYLDGRARPASVRWVGSMRTRWASCTPAGATIRVSERLRPMPAWVQDYVLVHELAHLIEPGHGPRFWALVQRYPRTERARGYLDGVSVAAGLGIPADIVDDDTVEDSADTDTDTDADIDTAADPARWQERPTPRSSTPRG